SAHRAGGGRPAARSLVRRRSEEHTSELQSLTNLVCRLLLEKKKKDDELHTALARRREGARAAHRAQPAPHADQRLHAPLQSICQPLRSRRHAARLTYAPTHH